jgi:beta-galactosidase
MSVVDVMGLTYDYDSLAKMHSQRPDTPLLNGESSSCQSDRGDDDVSGVIGCSRDAWATADQNEWDIGAFSWSGTDYRGECGGWPQTVSYYGILDICGFDKGVSIWYQVWWGLAAGWPNISSLVKAWPPWSGTGGSNVKITAVAAAASLQLAVNGIAQGEPVSLSHLSFATWSVPFSPGNYSITSFDSNGAVLGYVVSQSSGSATALLAQVDWQGSGPQGELLAGQRDAALIVISVIDSNGIVVRSANLDITVTVTGPGELLGLGNGDHLNHLPGQGITTMPAYKGFLRAIVRSGQSATGAPVVVTASADRLVGTFIEIDVV